MNSGQSRGRAPDAPVPASAAERRLFFEQPGIAVQQPPAVVQGHVVRTADQPAPPFQQDGAGAGHEQGTEALGFGRKR